jgi:hypothetical protein
VPLLGDSTADPEKRIVAALGEAAPRMVSYLPELRRNRRIVK